MTFVMNIGDDLHWLSLRCYCLYFKPNLPLLLCFFFVKSYCTCELLIYTWARFKILQLCLFIHTVVHVPSVVRSFNSEKVTTNLLCTTQRVVLAIEATVPFKSKLTLDSRSLHESRIESRIETRFAMTTSRFSMSASRFSISASRFSISASRFSYSISARLAKPQREFWAIIDSRHSNSGTASLKVWTLYTSFIAARIALCKGLSYRLIGIIIGSDETTLDGLWSIAFYQARWIYIAKTNKTCALLCALHTSFM